MHTLTPPPQHPPPPSQHPPASNGLYDIVHLMTARVVFAEGAHLLGCLIHSAPRLVMPYVGPILKALVSKLRSAAQPLIIMPSPQGPHMQKGGVQGGGETGVMASVLATTGELARVAGCNLRAHIGDILPLIIDAIGHPTGANKSVVAVATLGQVGNSPKPSCQFCSDFLYQEHVINNSHKQVCPFCSVFLVLGTGH